MNNIKQWLQIRIERETFRILPHQAADLVKFIFLIPLTLTLSLSIFSLTKRISLQELFGMEKSVSFKKHKIPFMVDACMN